jgi:UDPglucose 6-dehydrogenase
MSEDGTCDLSIIEEVIGWLETDLICIKSTIEPGTVDRLREKFNKRITYSVEIIGEGKYFIPPWKYPHATDPTQHDYLVVGGDPKDTSAVANIFWSRLSPDLNIYQMSGTEAEMTKYMLNTWGAMKVTFANEFYEICKAHDVDYMKVLQAWGADGRVEKMHMRVVEGKQGFGGKCFPKDVNAIYQAC